MNYLNLENFVSKREMIADEDDIPDDEALFKKQALIWAKVIFKIFSDFKAT